MTLHLVGRHQGNGADVECAAAIMCISAESGPTIIMFKRLSYAIKITAVSVSSRNIELIAKLRF